ncbi:MAG: TolC family protein [Bacteroidales bacterium]
MVSENIKTALIRLAMATCTRCIIGTCAIIAPNTVAAQDTSSQQLRAAISIEECYTMAKKNYPLIKKYALIEKSREYSLSNANKNYLPQLSLSAKATYQSEVMEFPASLPISGIPVIPKDQYNAAITLNQIIWDGGVTSGSKKQIKANAQVEQTSLESDLYTIRERINNLYFGILLAKEQINQTKIFKKELEINYKNIESYISAGLANGADLDIVKVEQLKNTQRQKELESTQESYLQMLSYLTGVHIKEISIPIILQNPPQQQENRRPELALFEAQITQQQMKRIQINAAVMPKFSLFLEGGVGNPALNMLDPGFRGYGMGGVKLAWNFGGFYTRKNDLNLMNTAKQTIETQKDIFLFNTNMEAIQEKGEIDKIKKLVEDDNRIIILKENIIKAAQVKAANGTMTMNELLNEINSRQEAVQTKIYHNIQFMLATYNLKYTLNQ